MTTAEILDLMRRSLDEQRERSEQLAKQHTEQLRLLTEALGARAATSGVALGNHPPSEMTSAWPTFGPFNSTEELWSDYWSRFLTFCMAHCIPDARRPAVFLTNQSPAIYKMLANLASQQQPTSIDINELSLQQMHDYMEEQFHPTRFVVRERFKFWSQMDRKPAETVLQLAARIRQDAATCDFGSTTDPLDEAMRTRFICSIQNEAALKALFKIKNEDLTFARAIETAQEIEEAAKVAKETVCMPATVHPVKQTKQKPCYRCGKQSHTATECRHKDTECDYCSKKGHLEKVCLKKKRDSTPDDKVGHVHTNQATPSDVLTHSLCLNGRTVRFAVDTGTGDSFLGNEDWMAMGSPALSSSTKTYRSITEHPLEVLGTLEIDIKQQPVRFNVTNDLKLNLLGRTAIKQLGLSVDALLGDTVLHVREEDEEWSTPGIGKMKSALNDFDTPVVRKKVPVRKKSSRDVADEDQVCLVHTIGRQIAPTETKKTTSDPLQSSRVCFNQEGRKRQNSITSSNGRTELHRHNQTEQQTACVDAESRASNKDALYTLNRLKGEKWKPANGRIGRRHVKQLHRRISEEPPAENLDSPPSSYASSSRYRR